MKNCKTCGTNDAGFQKDRTKPDGLRNECKRCCSKKDKEKRERDPEASREKGRDNYRRNKEKRKKTVQSYYAERGGKEKERDRIRTRAAEALKRLGGRCGRCGREDRLSIDHVNNDGMEERRKGGKDRMVRKILSNPDLSRTYQVLCHNCNHKKQLETIRERVRARPRTGELKACPTCYEEMDECFFHRDVGYGDGLYYECIFCTSNRRRRIKERALTTVGGACAKCGETDVDVLCVDHIKPVGKNRSCYGFILYNKIIAKSYDRQRFQVLCVNCNQEKGGSTRPLVREEELWKKKPDPVTEPQVCSFEQLPTFELHDLRVVKKAPKDVMAFLDGGHYDGYGRHAKECYAAVLNDELVTVAKLCSQTRHGTAKSLNLEPCQVLELDRLCAHPGAHKKNLLSWFLSRLIKKIHADYPEVRAVVSFADLEQGHDGAVYRASNWEESGRTAPSYHYLTRDGQKIKKKTFYDWIKVRGLKSERTELEVAKSLGMERIKTAPKIRYTMKIR